MGFLDIFRPKKSHIEDLRALIVEYKNIIDELKRENKELKERLELTNLQIPKTRKTNLSPKEKRIFNAYNKLKDKDINKLSDTLKIPVSHLRVYKNRLKKKGYVMNV